ncbi:type I restriction endonuclease subunit R, EcoR124 family [Anaeromicropila populeti]|uniref:type I restriction endonuclease subunit R, EcoR124 family n=1 Tax=Anaeromicropila populeti TaxID=37658 RepID=UPI002343166B|nr:hypothetical protein [Anaeromicropila populeti]
MDKAIYSSMNFRSKLQLIQDFIKTVTPQTEVDVEWKKFVEEQQKSDLLKIIREENLKIEETLKFMEK